MLIVSAVNRTLRRLVVLTAVVATATSIAVVDAGAATRTHDTTPPTIIVSQPAEGATVATGTVNVVFSATDASGIRSVKCKLSTERRASACASPKSYVITKPGSYSVTITAVDRYFNFRTVVRKFNVAVPDTTPPAVSITSPLNGQVFATDSVTASFTATDPGSPSSGIASTSCRLAGPSNVVVSDATCQSPTTFNNLSNGGYSLTVTATDVAGNSANSAVSFSVNVPDTTQPVVTISAPLNGQVFTTDSVTAVFTATDPGSPSSGIASTSCRLTGPSNVVVFDAACQSPTVFSTLANGSYVLTVFATDVAGNTASGTVNFTIDVVAATDTVAPVINISSPLAGETVITSDSTLTATFDVTDVAQSGVPPSGVKTVTCWMNGAVSFGESACALPKTFSGVVPGDYVFVVRATDNAGNTTYLDRRFTVQICSGCVDLRITYPSQDNQVITVSNNPAFQFVAKESNGLAMSTGCAVTPAGQAPTSFTPCTSPWPAGSRANGNYTLTVQATDSGGTVRTVARNFSIQVSSDTTPPGVNIFGVSIAAGTAQISWTASDNVGVVDTICTMSAPGSTFIDRFGCTSPTVYSGLASGLLYTFTVHAFDAAGNHGSASTSFFMP